MGTGDPHGRDMPQEAARGLSLLDGQQCRQDRASHVRLALPRRVYTRSHYDHVADTLADIAADPESVRGYRIVGQSPILRHFSIELAPVPSRN
ncbi:hypothetical protein ACH4Y0_34545 [Streptomyces sp. NPDC020707]|uniref:hypothetical protein n=1 Tax=Streptomyces sp. NPDC020707 TaxID=3365084 RepID=UPI0037BB5E0F